MPRKKKRAMGRPSKYSPVVVRKICRAIARGCNRHTAAGLAGVSGRALFEWLNKFSEFADAVERADSKFKAGRIRLICKAGKSSRNWTANAWLLERKFPEEFGRVDRHHVIRAPGSERAALPSEYVEAILKALGVRGPLIPINDKGEPIALPAGRTRDTEVIDLEVLPRDADDLDPLPVLPN